MCDLRRIIPYTELDIIFLKEYKNPESNSLKEFGEDLKTIENLKRYVKSFYVKKNKTSYHKLLNNIILLSNIFDESSYNEILMYIAYKYFYVEQEIFTYFCNVVFFFFNIVIDKNCIRDEYVLILKNFG